MPAYMTYNSGNIWKRFNAFSFHVIIQKTHVIVKVITDCYYIYNVIDYSASGNGD